MGLIAFHGRQEVKKFYLKRVQEHIDLDEIVKGVYFEDGEPGKRRMCGIGCTIHSNNHSDYEKELGIPQTLAKLEDRIFENLPNELAKTWPLRFLESINVGVDLSKVWPNFAIFLLTDATQCNSRHSQCNIVANAFKSQLNNENVNWNKIKSSAYAAAAADDAAAAAAYAAVAAYAYAAAAVAAYAYAAAAAADDAYAAAAAADDAAAAAYAADAAAAYAADAKQNAYIKQSEKLLELLKECK